MEKIVPKDTPNSLPIAIVLPTSGPSAGQTDNFIKRSEQGSSDFSDKLSAALDKPEVTEPVAKKSNPKPVKDGQTEENPEVMQSGLPIGLTSVQQEVVTPAQMQIPTLSEGAPIKAASNPTEILENLLQNKNIIASAAQTIMGPIAGLATQVAASVVQGLAETAKPSTEATTTGSEIIPMFDGKSLETPQIASPKTSDATPQNAIPSLEPVPPSTPQVTVSTAPVQSVIPEIPATLTGEKQSASQSQPVQPQPSQVQPVQPPATTIDPLIQQDIVSVQVSTDTKVSLAPMASATPVKVEVKNAETRTDVVTGVVEQETDPVVVSTSEKDLSQEYLGHEEPEALLKSDHKTDSSAMAPVTFDKVLNSVDPAPIAREVAPPQRQDPYEVARQVMDGMSLSTDRLQSSQVIITLKPEHLGEVTVKINVDGDRVTAAFQAASSEVRAILESSLPQLRQEMSQQGWNFDSSGVFSGMQEFMAGQQQQQQAQEQQMLQFANHAQRDEYDDAVAFTNNGRLQVMSSSAVDYRI